MKRSLAIILLMLVCGFVQESKGQDKQINDDTDIVSVNLNAGAIRSVASSPDGKTLAIGCISGHAATVMSVAFNQDGERIASVDTASVVQVWDLPSLVTKD